MFEDLNITDKTNLDIKLYEEKSWMSFQLIKTCVNSDLHPEVNDWHSIEAINHTLAYLKPLLERGELKACGLETLHPNVDGKTSFREFIGTSDEIINQIRSLWSEARQKAEAEKKPAILAMFESFGVMFVTAEGMIGMKRTFLEK